MQALTVGTYYFETKNKKSLNKNTIKIREKN